MIAQSDASIPSSKPTSTWRERLGICACSVLREKRSSRLIFGAVVFALIVLAAAAQGAVVEEDPNLGPKAAGDKTGFVFEYLNYQDHVYSQSQKTELGDAVNLDVGLRYQFDANSFGRVRFATDPVQNRENNKSSEFEFLGGHKRDNWYFQIDTKVLTNDGTTGGTSIGLDLLSELTSIKYADRDFDVIFYPFNFDGEVGSEFNTWDVTRIYSITGAPTTINATPVANEKVTVKTIPGIEMGWVNAEEGSTFSSRAYVGIGAATFLYPNASTFNIETAPTADRWERREDVGYKIGFNLNEKDVYRVKFQIAGHTDTEHTGALLAAAASLYSIGRLGPYILEGELTGSKAGSAPYRLARTGDWFEDTAPFQPVYSDVFGTHQNWIGKTDGAASFRIGYETSSTVPYLSVKYQGPRFIFRDRESAHRLRTGDESDSHGGLTRLGVGAFFNAGQFAVNPELEYFKAKNAVFANASDVRSDRRLASFKTEDYQLSLLITYRLDENRTFRP